MNGWEKLEASIDVSTSDLCPKLFLWFLGTLFFYLVKLNQAVCSHFGIQHSSLVCSFSVTKTSLVEGSRIWWEVREHKDLTHFFLPVPFDVYLFFYVYQHMDWWKVEAYDIFSLGLG